MRIRQFDPRDYEAAAAIWAVAEGVSGVSLEEVERKLERDPHLFLVAEDESSPPTVVGVVIGSYDGRRGWIFRLAVAPRHRRQGVGSRLVAELERRFHEMGVDRIRLLTLTDNEPALRFWANLGYRGFEDVILFSKELGAERKRPNPPDDEGAPVPECGPCPPT